MKNILIVIGQLRVGGVAKALINLLNCIKDDYDVTLLCFDNNGALFENIPDKIKIIESNNLLKLSESSATQLMTLGYKYAFLRCIFSGLTKVFGKRVTAKIYTKILGKIAGNYDVAISYIHPMSDKLFCNLTNEVILDCVSAKRKAIFIHCDFKSYGGNTSYNRRLIRRFDKVISVSYGVQKALLSVLPEISNKSMVVRNCINFDEINRLSEEDTVKYNHNIIFVTVARLSEEKGLFRCIRVFSELYNDGFDIEWHIVGDGPLKSKLISEINQYNASKFIILEGEQSNPYKFMKNADYLLVPSFHEAAPVVFDEARTLGLKIVTTRTLSADEMVLNVNAGYVCDNNDDCLSLLIENVVKNHYKAYHTHLSNPVLNNINALNSFSEI